MDGLDAFRPVGDADFARLRPTVTTNGTIRLDDFWGLHPALRPLLPLWSAGEMGVVPAVSTPYRDKRSHFDGQDLLEAGGVALDGTVRDGWLNRLLQSVSGHQAELAYGIGADAMPVLMGPAPTSRWSPNTQLNLSAQAERLLELVHADDPLFHATSERAIEIAADVALAASDDANMRETMGDDPMMAHVSGRGTAVSIAEFAAARLRGDTRIASFSLGGWDTHFNQANAMTRALEQLSDAILTLRAGLGPIWDKTAVLCLTEFGRTARENGTRGTDHGTGGAMMFAGGAMRGGQFVGRWPGLSESALYDRRDLMPVADVRAMAGWVMRGLFGVEASLIENTIFPGLDLGGDPGILL